MIEIMSDADIEDLEELVAMPMDVAGANDLIRQAVLEIRRAQSSERAYRERNVHLESQLSKAKVSDGI